MGNRCRTLFTGQNSKIQRFRNTNVNVKIQMLRNFVSMKGYILNRCTYYILNNFFFLKSRLLVLEDNRPPPSHPQRFCPIKLHGDYLQLNKLKPNGRLESQGWQVMLTHSHLPKLRQHMRNVSDIFHTTNLSILSAKNLISIY